MNHCNPTRLNGHERPGSAPDSEGDKANPPEAPLAGEPLSGGTVLPPLDAWAEPVYTPPDLLYIQALKAKSASAGEREVRQHQERCAAGANAPLEYAAQAALAVGLQNERGLAASVAGYRQELARLKSQQFIDTRRIHGAWTLWDRLLCAGLVLLTTLLLAADWWNARTQLKTAGVPEFLEGEMAALCASAGAVLLAVTLKVLATSFSHSAKVRALVLLLPSAALLTLWILLMSIAFPGYVLDVMSNLTDLQATMPASSGLPSQWAWALPASSCLGFAVAAAGVSCFAEDLYRKYQGAAQEVNPQYATMETALQAALQLQEEQAVRLGTLRGLLRRIQAVNTQSVELAVALYTAQSTPPSGRTTSFLSFFKR